MISLTSPVETRAHGWPAGAKLAGLCLATVMLFAVEGLVWHLGFLAAALCMYALPGWSFFQGGMRRLRVLWPFAVIILLWHYFTNDFANGAVIVVRMITAVGLANLVTMTTKLSDMIEVVRWLSAPLRRFGVQTRSIELAIALVVRFTPVLAQKGQTLALAWKARAARRLGWRVITPFAILAIDDAEHVAEALRARGGL
ncbi:energy-coupling factor transporter transmembrane protein EcfT [Sulfitobacter sp. M368]|uniref:energy-coupling factor transporter transmembrane component T family protein n=1 Tax=Sulfitobacter sp. M368 TaxID=2867021 RepID=UPI0021A6DEEA|nr:energy-coupling factor transporter transmembrane component T [Sulfitobacter sp. M368]UWR15777.1 energy-coupling factor transporter transmembrane protein EcfT [Sulfitobacter sp. M368]